MEEYFGLLSESPLFFGVAPEELVPQNDFQRMVLDIHLHNGGLRSGFGILKAEYNKL